MCKWQTSHLQGWPPHTGPTVDKKTLTYSCCSSWSKTWTAAARLPPATPELVNPAAPSTAGAPAVTAAPPGWWRSKWWRGTCSSWSPTSCSHRSASSDPCSCGGGCLFSSRLLWVGSAAVRNCHLLLTFWLIRKSPALMALCGWPWGEICAPWTLATRAMHILPGEYLCQEYLDRQFFILYPMGQFYIHLWMSSHCKARPFALSAMPQGQQIRHIEYWCHWNELFHKKVYSLNEQN